MNIIEFFLLITENFFVPIVSYLAVILPLIIRDAVNVKHGNDRNIGYRMLEDVTGGVKAAQKFYYVLAFEILPLGTLTYSVALISSSDILVKGHVIFLLYSIICLIISFVKSWNQIKIFCFVNIKKVNLLNLVIVVIIEYMR